MASFDGLWPFWQPTTAYKHIMLYVIMCLQVVNKRSLSLAGAGDRCSSEELNPRPRLSTHRNSATSVSIPLKILHQPLDISMYC